jgi:hypothetical protein
MILPSLNPSPLGRDFEPPKSPQFWGDISSRFLRVTCLSSIETAFSPQIPPQGGYLVAISSHYMFELSREELRSVGGWTLRFVVHGGRKVGSGRSTIL